MEGSVQLIYIKSFLFGIGGAIVASVLWIVVTFVIPIYVPYVIGRVRGVGGISSAYLSSGSVLAAALLGFVVAFAWEWSRLRAG